MEKADKIKQLRELTGMNRKEFCEYFQIPYRTVSEWERDGRHAPDYRVRLLEYYIRTTQITKDKVDAKQERNLEASIHEHFEAVRNDAGLNRSEKSVGDEKP
jgi:putative transcriptional regulator